MEHTKPCCECATHWCAAPGSAQPPGPNLLAPLLSSADKRAPFPWTGFSDGLSSWESGGERGPSLLPCKQRKLIFQLPLIFGLNYKLGAEIKDGRKEGTGTAESQAAWHRPLSVQITALLPVSCIIHQHCLPLSWSSLSVFSPPETGSFPVHVNPCISSRLRVGAGRRVSTGVCPETQQRCADLSCSSTVLCWFGRHRHQHSQTITAHQLLQEAKGGFHLPITFQLW